MSEIRANKIAALGADIQFWTGAPTEKLRIDAAGNLCFGDVGRAGAHIPPPDGIAPMYSARAWGRIIANASTGAIQYNLSKTNNINMSTLFSADATRWEYGNSTEGSDMRLEVRFLKALPSEYYTVVANCNLSTTAPLLVARANSLSLDTGFGLMVYNARGTDGTGYLSNPAASGYPELIEFVVFA